MRPMFKTEMLIFQSKANLDEKILFGSKITNQLDSHIAENAGKRQIWGEDSTFQSGP